MKTKEAIGLSLNCAFGICVCGFEAMGNPKSQRVEKEVVVLVLHVETKKD